MLTLLLVRAGEPVSTDAVAQAIWGDRERRSASTVTSHLSRLRSMLGSAGTGEPVLGRTGGGLRPGGAGRADRFPPIRDVGRPGAERCWRPGNRGPRSRAAAEATALWRGRPYSPLSDEPWVAPAVARLEELYAQVRERFLEGLLAVGDPERVLVELRTEIPARPLRERLWALRMLAEYRTGRLDEALRTFHDARKLFLDELGRGAVRGAGGSAGRGSWPVTQRWPAHRPDQYRRDRHRRRRQPESTAATIPPQVGPPGSSGGLPPCRTGGAG